MAKSVVLVSVPGLRGRDLGSMPRLQGIARKGMSLPLSATSTTLAATSQTNMLTGVSPEQHGIVATRLLNPATGQPEPNPSLSQLVGAPRLWETLKQRDPALKSAVWFAELSEGAVADAVCSALPANPSGEASSFRIETRPADLVAELQESLGAFPEQGFAEPESSINAMAWLVDSFLQTAYTLKPRFSFVAIPHLESVMQTFGPDSTEVGRALGEVDLAIGALSDGLTAAGIRDTTWLIASQSQIIPVTRSCSPVQILQAAGLLTAESDSIVVASDHQIAHIHIRDASRVQAVADLFDQTPEVAEVLTERDRSRLSLNHPRSGDVILLAQPDATFEDSVTEESSPRIKGSFGLALQGEANEGVLVCSESPDWLSGKEAGITDLDIHPLVLNLFGFESGT